MGGFVDVLYDNRRAGITDAMTINMALGKALPSVIKEGFISVRRGHQHGPAGRTTAVGTGRRTARASARWSGVAR